MWDETEGDDDVAKDGEVCIAAVVSRAQLGEYVGEVVPTVSFFKAEDRYHVLPPYFVVAAAPWLK